jgi:toxin HigB-1
MILRFRHRGLERLHRRGDTSGVSPQHVRRLRAMLAALETALVPSDMALPGGRLHPCMVIARGNGRCRSRAIGVWCSSSRARNVTDVDLIDYH